MEGHLKDATKLVHPFANANGEVNRNGLTISDVVRNIDAGPEHAELVGLQGKRVLLLSPSVFDPRRAPSACGPIDRCGGFGRVAKVLDGKPCAGHLAGLSNARARCGAVRTFHVQTPGPEHFDRNPNGRVGLLITNPFDPHVEPPFLVAQGRAWNRQIPSKGGEATRCEGEGRG